MRGGQLSKLGQPREAAIGCALAATCLGIVYLIMAGAPLSYPVVNAVAFLLGVVALGGVSSAMARSGRYSGPVLVTLGLFLVATAMFGAAAEGASRWIMIGPLSVQVSLVLLPFMAATFARQPTLAGFVGIALAAVALALQPDRAMAGVLAFGMVVLAGCKPGRLSVGASLVALTAFLASLARADTLPAVPFVDQILFTAFEVHFLVGAAVLLGSLLLLVPPILGWRRDVDRGHAYLVLGAIWLGCIVSAAVGNYPTPVVGYGGSAILGYLLSFSALASSARSARDNVANNEDDTTTLPGLSKSASLA